MSENEKNLNVIYGELLNRCWKDKSYLERFRKEPAAVLSEAGIPVKEGAEYHVMEQSQDKFFLILPQSYPAEKMEKLDEVKAAVKVNAGLGDDAVIEVLQNSDADVYLPYYPAPKFTPLSNEEVEQLFRIIATLKEQKVSIIYISHRMEELFRISDRVTVIRDGQYVGTRPTKETNPNELVAMMVGRDLQNFYSRDFLDLSNEAPILEVKNLTCTDQFEDVSFSVRKGEILGFSGLVGAGRSEIMQCIFGAREYQSGTILYKGEETKFKNPMQALKAGIAMVPEDRKKEGLVLGNSVAFNLTLSSLHFCMNGIAISEKKRKTVIGEYFQKLRIKAASPAIEAQSLSGGNQQKVVLAKWLATKPEVLILDEPTRGVDVNAKYEIYLTINELAKQGLAIIMVSSELPEIINMCDNVCVVREGKLVKTLPKEELSQEEIMKYAAGGDSYDQKAV